MYAEPGAVVIRLVRRTAIISLESPKDEIYKCDEVRELVSLFVVLMLRHVWEIYVRISAAQDMMRGGLVFASGQQPWSCLLCGYLFQLSRYEKYENCFVLKSRLSQQTRDLGANAFWRSHLNVGIAPGLDLRQTL